VKVLLDENLLQGLVRVLRDDGLDVEHIITLGWRGVSVDTDRDIWLFELNDDGALVPWSTIPPDR
jgi:predicted nuclease of predicted toxin-antitoxin system